MDKWKKLNLFVLCGLMPLNIYLIFFYAPLERTMGVIQKVFYFHIASAWIGLLAFFIVFAASIAYLITRGEWLSHIALAAAEIGTVFITGVLVTGPLWARPIWNTWWTWDPRLTTTLVLWFMYLAYILLQRGGWAEERRRLAAVYGIVSFVNVPLVFFSVRWWRTIHPVVISSSGINLTSEMVVVLLFSLFTFSLLFILLLLHRFGQIELAGQINRLKQRLRS